MGGLFSFFQGGLDQVSSFLKTPWDPKASPGRIQTSPPSEELLVASGPSNRNELHHESCWDIAHTCVRISKQFRISKSKKVSKHAVRGKEGPILWWAPSDANEGGVNEAILRLPCKQLHHQCQTKQLQYIYICLHTASLCHQGDQGMYHQHNHASSLSSRIIHDDCTSVASVASALQCGSPFSTETQCSRPSSQTPYVLGLLSRAHKSIRAVDSGGG